MYDLIIKGGQVLDGTGAPAQMVDIGIIDGKIASIKPDLNNAQCYIDATGLTVTPGFIDSHSHADKKVLDYPEQRQKLEQGVTTSVAGQCGSSFAPNINQYKTMGSFLEKLKTVPLGANFACFIGHGTVRKIVIGSDNRLPTEPELERMKDYLREAFENGASGLSFGLFYAPGCYADKAEAIELAKVAKEYNKPVSAHIRTESDQVVDAVEEFIDIIRQSGCRGILSHHKAVQKRNWGKVNVTLELLKNAVNEGIDIYCDVYPYCASSTTFSQAFVPNSWRAGGRSELLKRIQDPVLNQENKARFTALYGTDVAWIMVNSCSAYPEFSGLTLDVIASKMELDPYDAAMKLIIDSEDSCNGSFFSVNEEDLKKVMAWDRAMICTDSGIARKTTTFHHPRLVGSFPRAIGLYSLRKNVVCVEEMIRKSTSLPAHVYGFIGKGLIKEGYDADICIFDAQRFIDKADFKNCDSRAEGLNYVIVSGHVVAENAVFNGKTYGKVL